MTTKNESPEIRQFDFPARRSAQGFRLFPDDLENDPLVFFHGTDAAAADRILREGFVLPRTEPRTVSFAKNSNLALHFAMVRRGGRVPGVYRILAVQYDKLERHVRDDNIDIHDARLEPQPRIIGVMTIPETYQHNSAA